MITFFVTGTPKPKGNLRAFTNKKTGRPIITDRGGADLRTWAADIKLHASEAMGDNQPITGPVGLLLTFRMIRPKSHPKTKVTYPVQRPDADKLARLVLDALTSVCFVDDSQIVELHVFKDWAVGGRSGVSVKVTSVEGVPAMLDEALA